MGSSAPEIGVRSGLQMCVEMVLFIGIVCAVGQEAKTW